MVTIKEYLDYAELAQVAYGDLIAGMVGKDNAVYMRELTREDGNGEIKFSQTQAENFANRYKVLATSQQYNIGNYSSFDAVLFLDTQTGKKVMAIRGSQEIMDYAVDLGLGLSGVVYGQNVSLNNFYDALVADNKLSVVEKIDVTGHSLGGYLAQLFTAEHPYVVNSAYTYNAPGIGGLNQQLQDLFGMKNPSEYSNKITNIYAKEGSEFVAGLGVMLGQIIPLSIDSDSLDANNHKIGRLTESLHIYNMLSSIANTQDLNLLTSILEHTTNEKAISIVSDVFQYTVSGSEVDKAISLTKEWSGDATGITSLVDKSPSQLQSKRVENIYALLNLNPFVIEGDYLPAYANINPDDYSDMYMKDRADYMYYILDKDARYGDGIGKDSYKAWDTNRVLLEGKTGNQVIFRTNNYNNEIQMNGGEGDDRIYGLAGNDVLVGNGGNDTLEGGVGMDTLMGGADFDKYYAGNTDIIYDSDGKGEIYFDNINLSGVKTIVSDSDGSMYEDNNYTYFFENPNGVGTLTIIEGTNTGGFSGKYMTVNSFNASSQDGYLGITLAKKHVDIYVGDATVLEGGVLEFTVGIDNTLEEDLVLNVESYFDDTLGASADDLTGTISGTITIKAGETSGTFEITTNDDTDVEDSEKFIFAVTSIEPYTGNDMNSHLIVNAGEGTIDDNDDETVLHVNITSVNAQEGDLDDNNQLTFIIGASRVLKDGESVTLDLNINDITTDSSDYGFLSQDTITLNSTNQYQTITLDLFGDEEKEASETLSLNATVSSITGVRSYFGNILAVNNYLHVDMKEVA